MALSRAIRDCPKWLLCERTCSQLCLCFAAIGWLKTKVISIRPFHNTFAHTHTHTRCISTTMATWVGFGGNLFHGLVQLLSQALLCVCIWMANLLLNSTLIDSFSLYHSLDVSLFMDPNNANTLFLSVSFSLIDSILFNQFTLFSSLVFFFCLLLLELTLSLLFFFSLFYSFHLPLQYSYSLNCDWFVPYAVLLRVK